MVRYRRSVFLVREVVKLLRLKTERIRRIVIDFVDYVFGRRQVESID